MAEEVEAVKAKSDRKRRYQTGIDGIKNR